MTAKLKEQLGYDAPIFAFNHCRDVVVECTRAGGFGVLGSSLFSPEELDQELNWIDRHVGDRSYGVDILMTSNYDESTQKVAGPLADLLPEAQLRFVDEVLAREGVPRCPRRSSASAAPPWPPASATSPARACAPWSMWSGAIPR
ncbi:hypothetical protein ACFQY5_22325 [Paeniroseomonas aquatica]|uniref:hypothetical protein n=1 Tax=Paeniroseomonas aquatica TaxID=373043 RepID=UPI00361CC26C